LSLVGGIQSAVLGFQSSISAGGSQKALDAIQTLASQGLNLTELTTGAIAALSALLKEGGVEKIGGIVGGGAAILNQLVNIKDTFGSYTLGILRDTFLDLLAREGELIRAEQNYLLQLTSARDAVENYYNCLKNKALFHPKDDDGCHDDPQKLKTQE